MDKAIDYAKLPAHPCATHGCTAKVPFDDEPWCFKHSPDSGSSVPGYSWYDQNARTTAGQ